MEGITMKLILPFDQWIDQVRWFFLVACTVGRLVGHLVGQSEEHAFVME